MSGWLDLTGAKQESKETRRKTSRSGQPIVYYRDEWLRLKTRLYDGNVLRLSLIERVKDRESYWKRSRSGKYKHRSGSSEFRHQLQFSVSVGLDTYQIQPVEAGTSIADSHFSFPEINVRCVIGQNSNMSLTVFEHPSCFYLEIIIELVIIFDIYSVNRSYNFLVLENY